MFVGMKRKPVLVWAAIAALALAAGLFLVQFAGRGDPNSVEHLTQEITIRCSETGDEWTVARGRMERELLLRGTPIDPTVGLVNPKTGRPTGFPVDRDEWDRTIKRLNGEAREAEPLKKGGS
jgi:hypothetical protein